jgi:hypothetical protein
VNHREGTLLVVLLCRNDTLSSAFDLCLSNDSGEVGRAGIDWIDLAQDRDRWRALVNEVMNLRVQ